MITHRLKRITQTPRAFVNWPQLLRHMSVPVGVPETLTFRARTGQVISCPNVPGARVPVYEVFAEDCYRLADFLGPLRHRTLTVLDIGAHVGAFACQLASLAPDANVYCYEPSETTAAYLRRNVEANGLSQRVFVRVSAVSDTEGWASFADNGGGSALNGLVSDGRGSQVPTTTFDRIVGEIGTPELVKIDCEGGEYALVLGSDPSSWHGVRRLVLEYHPADGHDWPELRAWFAAVGLDVVRDEPATDRQGTAWLARQDAV